MAAEFSPLAARRAVVAGLRRDLAGFLPAPPLPPWGRALVAAGWGVLAVVGMINLVRVIRYRPSREGVS